MAGAAHVYANSDNVVGHPAAQRQAEPSEAAAARAAQAAIKKLTQWTGKMVDAALLMLPHGFPVFPLTIDKTLVPARDKDANGNPIPRAPAASRRRPPIGSKSALGGRRMNF